MVHIKKKNLKKVVSIELPDGAAAPSPDLYPGEAQPEETQAPWFSVALLLQSMHLSGCLRPQLRHEAPSVCTAACGI